MRLSAKGVTPKTTGNSLRSQNNKSPKNASHRPQDMDKIQKELKKLEDEQTNNQQKLI